MKVGTTAKSGAGSHLFTFTNGLVVRAGTLSELLAFFSQPKCAVHWSVQEGLYSRYGKGVRDSDGRLAGLSIEDSLIQLE